MDITDRAPFDRDTNMMFQDLALFPNYTVSENIAYGPKQSGIPEDERESMVEEMLEMVRLEGYGDRSIDELSGGEQQRVALARCMVNNPKLVLFDEPLASLDRQLRRDMTTELRNIQSETGSTFLYVTHNQQVALSVSDRVIVLNDGEIEQVGTPDDLYNDPQTEFVANFVGDMNMFVSDVVKGADTDETTDVGAHPVPLPASEPTPDGSELKVGVRPHEVDIAFDEDEVSGCYIEGEVNGTVFNGDRNVVTASTDKGEFISETEVDPSGGQSMYLHWPPAEMHFYATDGVDDE
jgi:spermidine/putrescine transport system ATP-binding protein